MLDPFSLHLVAHKKEVQLIDQYFFKCLTFDFLMGLLWKGSSLKWSITSEWDVIFNNTAILYIMKKRMF